MKLQNKQLRSTTASELFFFLLSTVQSMTPVVQPIQTVVDTPSVSIRRFFFKFPFYNILF